MLRAEAAGWGVTVEWQQDTTDDCPLVLAGLWMWREARDEEAGLSERP